MDAHQIFDQVSDAMKKRPHRESGVPTLRGACPLCGGSANATKLRVSLMGGYVLAHCYGCEAPSRDLLAAFGVEREPGQAAALPAAYREQDPKPFILEPVPPPAHIPFASAIDYLADIQSEQGSGVVYTHPDGRKGRHRRWATPNGGKETRNPGITGPGWYARIWLPQYPGRAVAIIVCEGEKDAARAALAGQFGVSVPGGAGRMGSADYTAVKEMADETSLPVLIAGDADHAGTRGVGAAIEALIDVGIRAAMWLPYDTTGCMLDHDLDYVRDLLERRFGNDIPGSEIDWEDLKAPRPKELWCTSPAAPSGMEYELAGEGQIRWSRFECGACLNCIAWRKKQIADRWERARRLTLQRTHSHICVTGLKPSQTQAYSEQRAAAMSALRKRTETGPWLRYTARDWDKLHIVTLKPLTDTERRCWELDAMRQGVNLSIMDGAYSGGHLASITPGVKTLEMRDAEGEPLRSMRTGYYSRDFPDFADAPPDYLQRVHGHLPEDLGESIEADWPIWARETRRTWRYASPKDQRTAYPRILLTVARWWLGDDYTREDVIAGRVGHPDLAERLIAEVAEPKPTWLVRELLAGASDARRCSHCKHEKQKVAVSPLR